MSNLPAIPAVILDMFPELQQWADSVKENIEVRNGHRGDALDRSVTFRDMVDAGMAKLPAISVPVTGGASGADALPIEAADMSPPPALAGFTATGALANVMLDWMLPPNTSNYSHTEIWRSTADNGVGLSSKIGTTTASLYTDSVGITGASYYYWIRGVSKQGQYGAFNAVAGTLGATGKVGNVDLTDLIIDANKIAAGAIDIGGTKVTGTITNPARFGALVVGSAAIANAAISNAKIADLAVDAAKIANASITNAKIGSLAVGSANIADAAITNAKIGTAAVDMLKIANNSVTVPVGALSASLYTVTTSYFGKVSASIDALGQPVMVTVSIPFYLIETGSAALGNFVLLKLQRDGVDIFAIDGTLGWASAGGTMIVGTVSGVYHSGILALTIKDTPASGSHTYSALVAKNYNTGSVYVWNASIQLIGVKR